MITPPPNPKAHQARSAMIAYRDGTDPKTQEELNAYVAASARVELVWSAVRQCWREVVTVTLFDKSAAPSERHDDREAQP